jgi:hypothetical protein
MPRHTLLSAAILSGAFAGYAASRVCGGMK